MIPVMVSVLQEAQIPTMKVAGMTMLLTFATSIGWILLTNGLRPSAVSAFRRGEPRGRARPRCARCRNR
jgi:hypothetical protein